MRSVKIPAGEGGVIVVVCEQLHLSVDLGSLLARSLAGSQQLVNSWECPQCAAAAAAAAATVTGGDRTSVALIVGA